MMKFLNLFYFFRKKYYFLKFMLKNLFLEKCFFVITKNSNFLFLFVKIKHQTNKITYLFKQFHSISLTFNKDKFNFFHSTSY